MSHPVEITLPPPDRRFDHPKKKVVQWYATNNDFVYTEHSVVFLEVEAGDDHDPLDLAYAPENAEKVGLALIAAARSIKERQP